MISNRAFLASSKRNVLLFGLVMFKKFIAYHYWTNFSYSVSIQRTTTEKMFDRWSAVFIHTAVMSWSMYYLYRNRTKCVYVYDRSRWTNWRNVKQERHIVGVDTSNTRIWINELYIFKFWPIANIRCGKYMYVCICTKTSFILFSQLQCSIS